MCIMALPLFCLASDADTVAAHHFAAHTVHESIWNRMAGDSAMLTVDLDGGPATPGTYCCTATGQQADSQRRTNYTSPISLNLASKTRKTLAFTCCCVMPQRGETYITSFTAIETDFPASSW